MSLVIESKNFPVHLPAKPNQFEFDGEVADIFENMAARSIPNYAAMHEINAKMIMRHRDPNLPYVIVDFGASTGMAMKAFCSQLQIPVHEQPHKVRYFALDNSDPMLDKVRREVPWAETLKVDCTKILELDCVLSDIEEMTGARADCVIMSYFLQFLRRAVQPSVVNTVSRRMRHQALFLFGAKEHNKDQGNVCGWMNDIYYEHRREMGYTQAEIDAKTLSLRGAMHTTTRSGIVNMLDNAGFSHHYELTRWLQFMSLAAVKIRSPT